MRARQTVLPYSLRRVAPPKDFNRFLNMVKTIRCVYNKDIAELYFSQYIDTFTN